MQEAREEQRRLERENHDLQSRLAEVTGQIDVIQVQKELTDQELEELRLCIQRRGASTDHSRLQDELERSRDAARELEESLRFRQNNHDQETVRLQEKLDEKEQLFQKIAEQRDQISLQLKTCRRLIAG